MTNAQKYKTAEERKAAHTEYCKGKLDCLDDRGNDTKCTDCAFNWLALEAEDEKLEPCPFCGSETFVNTHSEGHEVRCETRHCYVGRTFECRTAAIAAHNRVARAVRAAKESEAK